MDNEHEEQEPAFMWEPRTPKDRKVLDGKLICNALEQVTIKSDNDSASKKNTSEFKFARVHFYLKLPSMNFTKRL